jgi:hypothetical protein
LVATPDKTSLLALPNFAGSTGGTDINVLPLTPALAAGTTHAVTGDDTSLTGIAFFNGTAYYVAGPDFSSTGFLGTIDLGTFKTTRLTAITNGTQGSLPAHAISADKNGLIISGLNEIWQLTVSGTTATVVSKVTTPAADGPPTGPFAQWDQTSVDGNGHLFAANNNGNLLFIDYSGSGLIGSPVFSDERFLVSHLDDIANGGGAPPSQGTGCPATQGFWHKANHWPTVPGSVDGVTLALTPKITLTIGAGPGSETYSQAQILELLPSGSLHTGGVENDLSQFIAASLNLIAGAQHTAGIDSIISTIATDLTTTPPTNLFSIAGQVNIPPQAAIDLAAFGGALDAYNSATGLMCTEGAGLSVGGN